MPPNAVCSTCSTFDHFGWISNRIKAFKIKSGFKKSAHLIEKWTECESSKIFSSLAFYKVPEEWWVMAFWFLSSIIIFILASIICSVFCAWSGPSLPEHKKKKTCGGTTQVDWNEGRCRLRGSWRYIGTFRFIFKISKPFQEAERRRVVLTLKTILLLIWMNVVVKNYSFEQNI